jgi:hypothetical protein
MACSRRPVSSRWSPACCSHAPGVICTSASIPVHVRPSVGRSGFGLTVFGRFTAPAGLAQPLLELCREHQVEHRDFPLVVVGANRERQSRRLTRTSADTVPSASDPTCLTTCRAILTG